MNEVKHVKPAEGKVVMDPTTKRPLPKEGTNVEFTTYWRRRAEDKDVVVSDAQKDKEKAPAAAAKAEPAPKAFEKQDQPKK